MCPCYELDSHHINCSVLKNLLFKVDESLQKREERERVLKKTKAGSKVIFLQYFKVKFQIGFWNDK